METENRVNNGGGGGGSIIVVSSSLSEDGQTLKGRAIKVENGDATKSAGSSGDVFRTYKRRKRVEVLEDGKERSHSAGQNSSKSVNEPLDAAPNKCSHANGSAAYVKPRGILEQMLQSLQKDGVLKESILEALASHSKGGYQAEAKESEKCCEPGNRTYFPSQFVSKGIHNGVDAPSLFVSQGNQSGTKAVSAGSENEPKSYAVTEYCQHIFRDIVKSETFSQLCNVISENFEGMKVDSFLDINLIDTRMRDGFYEGSPLLFHSDIQQMWTKLQEIGSEIIALSRSLSEMSRASFSAQVSGSVHENSVYGKDELVGKKEQAEVLGVNRTCACRHCGKKADGRDSLVCDSCEEIYHVSCVQPTVKEIPLNWYCAKCTAKGIESPHDNCVACERLNASRSFLAENEVEDMLLETESSNSLMDDEHKMSKGAVDLPLCNLCRTEVRSNENFRVCGHSFCLHKFYHEGCLTRKQLESHGPCWYCPSCLCRACLKDRDDDKIVLCDSCDHAYHIFCMQPPLTSVPRGKWFCRKCNRQIQQICKAKKTFETLQNELRNRPEQCAKLGVPKGKDEEALDKSGGVDMLLNAARTLNYQEDLAALGSKDL